MPALVLSMRMRVSNLAGGGSRERPLHTSTTHSRSEALRSEPLCGEALRRKQSAPCEAEELAAFHLRERLQDLFTQNMHATLRQRRTGQERRGSPIAACLPEVANVRIGR